MVTTIFSNSLFLDIILPFLLVFVLTFAVLQKSKVLGDGKKQIDALVALAIGLIVVSVGNVTHIILSLIPFLGVSLVIILVFLLMWGMVYPDGKFEVHKYVQWGIGVVVAIAVIVAVLIFTGWWDYLANAFSGSNAILSNIILVIIIVVGVVVVLVGAKKG